MRFFFFAALSAALVLAPANGYSLIGDVLGSIDENILKAITEALFNLSGGTRILLQQGVKLTENVVDAGGNILVEAGDVVTVATDGDEEILIRIIDGTTGALKGTVDAATEAGKQIVDAVTAAAKKMADGLPEDFNQFAQEASKRLEAANSLIKDTQTFAEKILVDAIQAYMDTEVAMEKAREDLAKAQKKFANVTTEVGKLLAQAAGARVVKNLETTTTALREAYANFTKAKWTADDMLDVTTKVVSEARAAADELAKAAEGVTGDAKAVAEKIAADAAAAVTQAEQDLLTLREAIQAL